MLLVWVIRGPLIATALNYLLAPKDIAEKGRVIFDAIAAVIIFLLTMLAVIQGLKEIALLLFALSAMFLYVIPLARFFPLFKLAKARHPELNSGAAQIFFYAQVIIPGLFPVLALMRAFALSTDVFIFAANFLTLVFLLISVGTMLYLLANGSSPKEKTLVGEAGSARSAFGSAASVDVPDRETETSLKPKKLNPAHAPKKPGSPDSKDANPPAPKKPSKSLSSDQAAPNAPSRIKAPSKPKKRF
jgi:hypothetical protein